MKRIVSIMLVGVGMAVAMAAGAQNRIDEQRMDRDIEIAENVLSTLIKQQMGKQRNFFPYEVEGNYTPGYGVTFRLPMDFGGPMMYMMSDEPHVKMNIGENYSYSYSIDAAPAIVADPDCEDCPRAKIKSTTKMMGRKKMASDSLTNVFNQRIIDAARNFIADYGDLIGQLTPDEKIMITNRHEGQRFWYAAANSAKRKFISLEGNKGDLTQYKQGKFTRDQLLSKIVVIDSESADDLNPDLELLSSIFNRMYRPDLARTYYAQENIYYERLKNYGVIYYMQVYSSNETDFKKFNMPTVNLDDIDKATRDKKVIELYPVFEKEIKESMLDYGRTLKSLGPDELLVFNIKLTKCEGCGIPRSVEFSVKNSVLQDYGSGKMSKEAAVGKVNVKKGAAQ